MSRNAINIIIKLVLVILCLALVIIGKETVSRLHLGLMLIGVAGLLGLLYDYNRKFN
ncbi:DUF6903 family protein [Bacillus sp. S3]|uniref:DUF6903 family protein n=1 Tax=Bacillus sp. S3 TaxID=486398 RepID=UPI0016802F9B|nr:hypothetical protein [Bacillus sp. S3]